MRNELYLKMREFYEVSPLAQKVAAPLKEGAVAKLQFEGDIAEYVSRFGECILNPTPERKIEFKLCANVVTGARMGYFGMMRLGGKKALDPALRLGIKAPKKFLP